MTDLLEKIKSAKELKYFIDMGFELYIYNDKGEIYNGNVMDFAETIMDELGVKNDG